jgi:hypothetical protein
LGDHTETLQVDHDPTRISYGELLQVFWTSHNPFGRPWSTQYRSAIFYADATQKRLAEDSKARLEETTGKTVHTAILPLATFHLAEGYHQKYRLRGDTELYAEISAIYPDPRELVDSTAAARLNGYLDGCADRARVERDLERLGLSEEAGRRLLDRIAPRR